MKCATLLAIWIASAPALTAIEPAPEPAPGSGSWSSGVVVEPESVEEVKAAVATTAAGHTLAVAREPGSQRVIGILRLPPPDQDFLDEGRPPVLQIDDGALYPALHRLENQGWITAEWKSSEHGRDAKVYELTKEGRRQLTRELESWNRLSSAVGLLLQRA